VNRQLPFPSFAGLSKKQHEVNLNVDQARCLVRIDDWNHARCLIVRDPLPGQLHVKVPAVGFYQHKRRTGDSIMPALRTGPLQIILISINCRCRPVANQASHELHLFG
jgi:hypothetical protein